MNFVNYNYVLYYYKIKFILWKKERDKGNKMLSLKQERKKGRKKRIRKL
jgi:hypothetical protein